MHRIAIPGIIFTHTTYGVPLIFLFGPRSSWKMGQVNLRSNITEEALRLAFHFLLTGREKVMEQIFLRLSLKFSKSCQHTLILNSVNNN